MRQLYSLFLLLFLATSSTIAQTAISPTTWTGHGASTTGASAFTTSALPATSTPGASAVNISQWDRASTSYTTAGTSYNSSNWTSGTSLSAAQSAGSYVYFTVTNNSSTQVEVTNVTVESQVSSTGPGTTQMQYAIGSGSDNSFGSSYSVTSRGSSITMSFSGTARICAGGSAIFKLYGWGSTSSSGTLRINDGTSITATFDTALFATASRSSPICAGGSLSFSGSAAYGTSGYSYSWAGPSGFSSTSASTTLSSVTTSAVGTYTLTVTDAHGCTDTATTALAISAPPTISLSPTAATICPGGAGATVTASGAGTGGTYSWLPAAGLSATTGATVTATPTSTNIYTVTGTTASGCSNDTTITIVVTPGAVITSTVTAICVGDTVTLTATPSGGRWTSSDVTRLSVDTTSGLIFGLSASLSTITYTLPTGCFTTVGIAVSGNPTIPSGSSSVCVGSSVTWSSSPSGGTWTTGASIIASVDATGGIITGVSAGTAAITYTQGGCFSTASILVNALPVITGAASVCSGSSVTWTGTPSGGVWSTSSSAIASVDATTGVVTGLTSGTASVLYTVLGCTGSSTITVVAFPSAISGLGAVCAGNTLTASASPTGGTWSSSDATIASVDGSGMVTGVSSGSATITYTIGTSCFVTGTVSVNPTPAITGTPRVCQGASTALGNTVAGGSWTTLNATVASVNPTTGAVAGVTADTTTIVYTLPTGCRSTILFTVNPLPSLTGATDICLGSSATYFAGGGLGSFSTTSTALSINATTGVANTLAVGIDTVFYTITSTGCSNRRAVTVNAVPAAISGPTSTCAGNTITLTTTSTGGVWSSSNATTATVNLTGDVTGVTGGVATISYTFPSTGCAALYSVTINTSPTTIAGPSTLCLGSTATYTNTVLGGTWTTTNSAVVSITPSGSGFGVSSGTATVSYTLPSGCFVTLAVSVTTVPPITGAGAVCAGQSRTYSNTATGGTWSSSNLTIASVDAATGDVYGNSAGTAIITYTLGTGCLDTAIITVNPIPAAITGGASGVCAGGGVITLFNASGGGTWSTSTASIASIHPTTGAVTGITAGTAAITYTNTTTGCFNTTAVTINPLPSAITGTLGACEAGGTTLLSSSTSGGTWSSSDVSVALVSATGTVTGGAAGTATITYTSGGCYVTATVTIAPLPGAFVTALSDTLLCPGGSVSLLAGTTSGSSYQWYTGAGAISGATSTFFTATTPALYRVMVTDAIGCSSVSASMRVTVNPVTAIATPTGTTSFCAGGSVVINANTGAGLTYQWLLGGTAISGATASSYTAGTTGNYAVMVTNVAGCTATSAVVAVTVLSTPSGFVAASGPTTFCAGGNIILTADSAGATTYQWQLGATNISGATNRSFTATTTGSYRVVISNGSCTAASASFSVNVLPLPSATVTVTGSATFCTGNSANLSATSVAGYSYQWFRGSTNISGATGVTYAAPNSGNYGVRVTDAFGCTANTAALATVTEIGFPTATASPRAAICQGGTTTLRASLTGTSGVSYQWQSSGANIAGATNSTYVAATAGMYAFVVVASAGCTMVSNTLNVIESPIPAPVITYTGGRLQTATTYRAYQWYKNGIAIFAAITYRITPTDTGRYTVKVTDSGGCEGTSNVYNLRSLNSTSVINITADEVSVYPNPVSGELRINAPESVTAILQAMDGRTMIIKERATTIDMNGYPQGVYLLRILDANGSVLKTERVVKE